MTTISDEMVEAGVEAISTRRAELIAQPLARIYEDLVRAALTAALQGSVVVPAGDDPSNVWDDYCEEVPPERRSPQGALAFGFWAAVPRHDDKAPCARSPDADPHGDGHCGCTERCKDRSACQYDIPGAKDSGK